MNCNVYELKKIKKLGGMITKTSFLSELIDINNEAESRKEPKIHDTISNYNIKRMFNNSL